MIDRRFPNLCSLDDAGVSKADRDKADEVARRTSSRAMFNRTDGMIWFGVGQAGLADACQFWLGRMRCGTSHSTDAVVADLNRGRFSDAGEARRATERARQAQREAERRERERKSEAFRQIASDAARFFCRRPVSIIKPA